ncbi:sigma-70 family RNA polymerase sigma factor [Clostridium sp.]|uniref:sigma-70 family RNA polymerase sigma factor n=1 Tax=Clostridium sp. TaxID=1506 RepID=UPI00291531A0|nr:sigma-70 family RNA polymerase sigma factor [Clostridium sp.]MDU7363898.1 sigma-70 family RNA polymerase sigma factor [Clostridium sp.]
MLSNEELVQLYQNGDNKALEELIESNRGIIYKIANKYNGINRELELDDLFQNGVLGLIIAAKKYKFDIENKAKFITYAVHYISRYIYICINGKSSKDIENNKFYNSCTSLNTPIGEEGRTEELGDFIEGVDYGFENIEENLYLENVREELEETMVQYNTLQQREVLKLRYGWNSKAMTLIEVGEVLGISRNRVRDVEKLALRKLRSSNWIRDNAKEFAELGYINKFYLSIFRGWGINI